MCTAQFPLAFVRVPLVPVVPLGLSNGLSFLLPLLQCPQIKLICKYIFFKNIANAFNSIFIAGVCPPPWTSNIDP